MVVKNPLFGIKFKSGWYIPDNKQELDWLIEEAIRQGYGEVMLRVLNGTGSGVVKPHELEDFGFNILKKEYHNKGFIIDCAKSKYRESPINIYSIKEAIKDNREQKINLIL